MVDDLEMLPAWAGKKKEAAQPPEGFAATLDQGPADLIDAPTAASDPKSDLPAVEDDPLLVALEDDAEGGDDSSSVAPTGVDTSDVMVQLDVEPEPVQLSEPVGESEPVGQAAPDGAASVAPPSSGNAARFIIIAALSLLAGLVAGYLYLVLMG